MKFLNSVKFYKNFIFKYFVNLLHKLFQQINIYFFKLLSEYNNPYQIYLLLRSKRYSF